MESNMVQCQLTALGYKGARPITLSGIGGMCWHGLGSVSQVLLDVAVTSLESVDDLLSCFEDSRGVAISVTPDCATTLKDFSEPWSKNSNIWIPSVEKTLVWYQRDGAMVPFDDDQLMKALQNYRRTHSDFNKLLEVARFYGKEKEMKASIRYSENFDKEFTPFYGFELQDIDK